MLSYRKKNRLLWAATGLFLLLAYRVAISPTVKAYRDYKGLDAQLQTSTRSPEPLVGLRQELRQAERFLLTHQPDHAQADPLLTGLAPLCQRQGVRIEALPPAQTESRENYSVVTRSVRLVGSYRSLVQVIHQLEHQLQVGRLASVQFAVREDLLRGTRMLYADCYLQQLQEASPKLQEK